MKTMQLLPVNQTHTHHQSVASVQSLFFNFPPGCLLPTDRSGRIPGENGTVLNLTLCPKLDDFDCPLSIISMVRIIRIMGETPWETHQDPVHGTVDLP